MSEKNDRMSEKNGAVDGEGTGQSNGSDGTQGGNEGTSQGFSQAQVDEIVRKRVARERQAADRRHREALTQLGVPEDQNVSEYLSAQQQQRAEDLRTQGKHKEALDLMESQNRSALEAKDAEIARLKNAEKQRRVQETLQAAFPDNLLPSARTQVTQLLQGQLSLQDNGEIRVMDPTGSFPLTTEGGVFQTVEGFVASFLASSPHFLKAASGQGANSSNGSEKTGPKTPGEVINGVNMKRALNDDSYLIENVGKLSASDLASFQ